MINNGTTKAYSWDDVRVQYYNNSTGGYVTYETEYDILFKRIDEGGTNMLMYVASVYQSPEQDLEELSWFLRTEVKNIHIQAAMFGRGGRDMMNESDWGTVGNIIKKEYSFINILIDDLFYGTITLNEIRSRLHAYANKANYTYHLMRTRAQRQSGKQRYMRVINARESCATCPPKANRWGDLETLELGMPADGNDACGSFCKCTVVYE